MSVLVIDDDEGVLEAHRKILEKAGFEVTAVVSAFEAFEAIKNSQFGAILCDHKMPNLDGAVFFEQLEELFPNLASRVVFVTGWSGANDAMSPLRSTGQPVLLKPVDVYELIREVKQAHSRPG